MTQRIILTFRVSPAQEAAEQREGTLPGAATWISIRSLLLRVKRAHPAQVSRGQWLRACRLCQLPHRF